ncbi:excinuclease ABC subunit UvrC [Candidatus Poribacteria bacterium]|jgi:excinuclease ABC subunit C|nr:excinuclease ABC subunit UvrC [Candidatus Poribacteria bacterium]MBT5534419.1 excinuclease ABC subunit UvrC [Candidatus Poribacteria bacterium]MBT5709585.1 excinuclease ABC subunit UvrC [Candidatus Poribacteria bacterium]MBT7807544.1 excinuclease ABC subunit UvrC [Candidatus Poribacteria bacterium]
MAYEHLQATLANMPPSPGVYLMKDRAGTVLYVGKAKSLRSRVRSYFQASSTPHATTIGALLPHVQAIEVLHASSAVDALILENNLIKQYQPRYNIKLKDDKRYPYIRVSMDDPYPAISVTRDVEQDGSKYFGPYVHAMATRETLKQLTRLFPIRTCNLQLKETGNTHRVCLDYHIGRCPGPCADLVSLEDYSDIVDDVMLFLSGKTKALVDELKARMAKAAENLDYERAAVLRDRIDSVERGTHQQRMDAVSDEDYDAVGCAVVAGLACAQVLMIRGGKLVEREHFFLTEVDAADAGAVLSAFVPQYYAEASFVPPTVVLESAPDMHETIEAWLSEKREGRVTLYVPTRGRKHDMAELASRNAETILTQREVNVVGNAGENPALRELMSICNLDRMPARIEAYDISNFGADIIVGSMVVFEDGAPARSEYRRFRVRDIQGPDDYAAMKQVITRRFSRGIAEGAVMPNLVIIDGGKGQLGAASDALIDVDYVQQPRFGLAKRYEHIFLPDGSDAIILSKQNPTLHLVQHIRNEAHRFAVNYLRRLRDKRMTQSVLDEIPHVGDRRKQALLKHFGDIDGVRQASLDELLAVRNITRPVAQRIFKHLHDRQPG